MRDKFLKIRPFLPSIGSWVIAGGLEVSGVEIPWLGYSLIALGFLLLIIPALHYRKSIGRKPVQSDRGQPSVDEVVLVDTLTEMHRRLVELQKEKAASTKIRYRKWEKVMPTLANKMGTVKIENWSKFKKDIKRRIQRLAPKPRFTRRLSFIEWVNYQEKVEHAALSVASQIKDELYHSKKWTIADGKKVSEWLDGYDWGIRKLRDNDPEWDALFKSISHYTRNARLWRLIQRHIDVSYIYNSVNLAVDYSGRFPKSPFSLMLHETLVGIPVSPVEAEAALGELLSKIERSLAKVGDKKEEERLLIEDLKIKQDVDGAKKVKGLEIENQDAELRRTSIDMRVRNVEEATGASFKQTNKPALSTFMIICECGERIGRAFTGTPPSTIKCPKCGREHNVQH